METLVEAIAALAAAALELLLWATCGVFLLLRATFSRRYRERLRAEWRSGWRKRAGLLASCAVWAGILVVAGYIWIPIFAPDSEKPSVPTIVLSESPLEITADGSPAGDRASVTLTLSSEDLKRLKDSKTFGEAVEILKGNMAIKPAKEAAEPEAGNNGQEQIPNR